MEGKKGLNEKPSRPLPDRELSDRYDGCGKWENFEEFIWAVVWLVIGMVAGGWITYSLMK